MPRPKLEVADIFRAHGPAYRRQHAGHLNLPQLKVMSAIENCRTAALTNCAEYDESLRRHGDLMVWISEEALTLWAAAPRTTPGGQAVYSDLAIELRLTFGMVFKQPLRQTQGLMGSIAGLLGAFLGLTPRRHQSGKMDWSGRVSKCGDTTMRGLLFEAGSCVIRQVKRFSTLKSWAVRLAGRRGFRKGA